MQIGGAVVAGAERAAFEGAESLVPERADGVAAEDLFAQEGLAALERREGFVNAVGSVAEGDGRAEADFGTGRIALYGGGEGT